jgi:hypothetical protein
MRRPDMRPTVRGWSLMVAVVAMLGVAVAGAWAAKYDEDEDEKKVSLESLPDAAKQSILKESAGKNIEDIAEITKDGQVIYETDIIADGKEIELQVAADGKVLSKKEESDGDEGEAGKEDDDEGEEDEKGEAEDDEKKVAIDTLPDAAKQSILKESAGNKIEDIEEKLKDGHVIYETDIIADGKEIELQVAADGKVVSRKEEKDGEKGEAGKEDDDEGEEDEKGEAEDDDDRKHTRKDAGLWTESFNLEKYTLTSIGKNDFFILEPGFQLVLEHKDGNDTEKLEITVLNETKKIGEVETRVVEERETVNGEVKEVSRNFFAFCKETADVFYLGEETDNYKDGKVTRGNDSWLANSGDAKAGLIMPGRPLLGAGYYQELAPGVAMDRARVVALDATLKTPAGTFDNCLKTEETNPLKPREREYKVYAPGIGLIQDEDLLLTKHGYINK